MKVEDPFDDLVVTDDQSQVEGKENAQVGGQPEQEVEEAQEIKEANATKEPEVGRKLS